MCYNCSGQGHFAKDCPEPKKQNDNRPQQPARKPFACYICHSPDHTPKFCPLKPKLYCEYCKMNSHNTVDCRNKAEDLKGQIRINRAQQEAVYNGQPQTFPDSALQQYQPPVQQYQLPVQAGPPEYCMICLGQGHASGSPQCPNRAQYQQQTAPYEQQLQQHQQQGTQSAYSRTIRAEIDESAGATANRVHNHQFADDRMIRVQAHVHQGMNQMPAQRGRDPIRTLPPAPLISAQCYREARLGDVDVRYVYDSGSMASIIPADALRSIEDRQGYFFFRMPESVSIKIYAAAGTDSMPLKTSVLIPVTVGSVRQLIPFLVDTITKSQQILFGTNCNELMGPPAPRARQLLPPNYAVDGTTRDWQMPTNMVSTPALVDYLSPQIKQAFNVAEDQTLDTMLKGMPNGMQHDPNRHEMPSSKLQGLLQEHRALPVQTPLSKQIRIGGPGRQLQSVMEHKSSAQLYAARQPSTPPAMTKSRTRNRRQRQVSDEPEIKKGRRYETPTQEVRIRMMQVLTGQPSARTNKADTICDSSTSEIPTSRATQIMAIHAARPFACHRCKSPNHGYRHCPKPEEDYKCYTCGSIEHWPRNCPHKPEPNCIHCKKGRHMSEDCIRERRRVAEAARYERASRQEWAANFEKERANGAVLTAWAQITPQARTGRFSVRDDQLSDPYLRRAAEAIDSTTGRLTPPAQEWDPAIQCLVEDNRLVRERDGIICYYFPTTRTYRVAAPRSEEAEPEMRTTKSNDAVVDTRKPRTLIYYRRASQ